MDLFCKGTIDKMSAEVTNWHDLLCWEELCSKIRRQVDPEGGTVETLYDLQLGVVVYAKKARLLYLQVKSQSTGFLLPAERPRCLVSSHPSLRADSGAILMSLLDLEEYLLLSCSEPGGAIQWIECSH